MAVEIINIDPFIARADSYLVVDVRSPKEYVHAHIPGAINLPLFTDKERKVVGTTYKQQSREKAIKIGLDYFGPKMKLMVNQIENQLKERHQKTILVHCWRGGMRSDAVSWLLDLYGFKVYKLQGGYKRFRNWALDLFEKKHHLTVLGGFTGSGKTEILLELLKKNQAVIDLEGLAKHKGSAFGNLDRHPQPSTEQFENELAIQLYRLYKVYKTPMIWVEGESSRIGNVNIPHQFFNQMKTADRINVDIPFEERLKFIVNSYGKYDIQAMMEATKRIQKRLGGLRMKNTLNSLKEKDLESAFRILLKYYDQAYAKSRQKFEGNFNKIEFPTTNYRENAETLLKHFKETA